MEKFFTQFERAEPCASTHMKISNEKTNCDRQELSEKKEKRIFSSVCFFLLNTFYNFCFISIYSVLNPLSEYIYFCRSTNSTSYTVFFASKIVKSLQCILKQIKVHISVSFFLYFVSKLVPTCSVYLTLCRIWYT